MKPRFIAFEGIDGCGKTTQAKKLQEYLNEQGIDVVFTREPYRKGSICSDIREILLKDYKSEMAPFAELFLFEATRAQHVKDVIKPSLDVGKTIICDRFIDSTIAYQGYGRGLNLTHVEQMNKIAAGGITPDITFFIDIPVEIAMKRSHQVEATVRDDETKDFYVKCRNYFLHRSEADDSFIRIDGTGTIEEVFEKIVNNWKCNS